MSFTSSFLVAKKLLVSYVGIVVEIVSTDTAYASDLVETKSMSEHDEAPAIEISIRESYDLCEGVELAPTVEILVADLGAPIDSVARKDMRGIEEYATSEDLPAQLTVSAFDEASSRDLLSEREAILLDTSTPIEIRLSPVPVSTSDEALAQDVLPIARKLRVDTASTEEVAIWGSVVGDAGYGHEIVASISIETSDRGLGEEVRVSPALLSVLDEVAPSEVAAFLYWEGTVYDHATPEDLAPYKHRVLVDECAGQDVFVGVELPVHDVAEHGELVREKSAELRDYAQHEEVRLSPIPVRTEDVASYLESQFSDRDTHVREEVGTFEDALVELHVPPIRERVEMELSSAVEESARFSEFVKLIADMVRGIEASPSGSTRLLLSDPYTIREDLATYMRQARTEALSLRYVVERSAGATLSPSGRRSLELRHAVERGVAEVLGATSRIGREVAYSTKEELTALMAETRFSSVSIPNRVVRDLLRDVSETSMLTRSMVYEVGRSVGKSIRYASLSKTTIDLVVVRDIFRTVSEATRLLLEVVSKVFGIHSVGTSRSAYVSTSLVDDVGYSMRGAVSSASMLGVSEEEDLGSGYRVGAVETTMRSVSMENHVDLSMRSVVDVAESRSVEVSDEVALNLRVVGEKAASIPLRVEGSLHLVQRNAMSVAARIVMALIEYLVYVLRSLTAKEVTELAPIEERLPYQIVYTLIYSPSYRALPTLYGILDRMVYVREGDFVYSEHFNTFVEFVNTLFTAVKDTYRAFVDKTNKSLPDVEELIAETENMVSQLTTRMAGEIVSSHDHNLAIATLKNIERILRRIRENL